MNIGAAIKFQQRTVFQILPKLPPPELSYFDYHTENPFLTHSLCILCNERCPFFCIEAVVARQPLPPFVGTIVTDQHEKQIINSSTP